jgi:hypothetical protein
VVAALIEGGNNLMKQDTKTNEFGDSRTETTTQLTAFAEMTGKEKIEAVQKVARYAREIGFQNCRVYLDQNDEDVEEGHEWAHLLLTAESAAHGEFYGRLTIRLEEERELYTKNELGELR